MSKTKRIILVIVDSRGVSRAFVTDDFKHLLLDEAIHLVRKGVLIGVQVVEAKNRTYLRSNANSSLKDNLDDLSVPAGSFSKKVKDPNGDERVSFYVTTYGKFLELKFDRDELIFLGGIARILKKDVIARLRPLAIGIKSAAKKYDVDTSLLAAILIDELARMGPDDLLDVLGKLGVSDTTVGLAQVKMSTARDLINKKHYSADPNISQRKLYNLLTDDLVSVQFAASYLSFIKKYRIKKKVGVSAAELATCYSEGLLAQTSQRGKQIDNKLREFAKEILE